MPGLLTLVQCLSVCGMKRERQEGRAWAPATSSLVLSFCLHRINIFFVHQTVARGLTLLLLPPKGSGRARPAQEVWLNHKPAWEMPRQGGSMPGLGLDQMYRTFITPCLRMQPPHHTTPTSLAPRRAQWGHFTGKSVFPGEVSRLIQEDAGVP